MTAVTAAPDEVRKHVESELAELRSDATQFVRDSGGSVALGALLDHLKTRTHRDDLISRALAGMLSHRELVLTSERKFVLPSS